MMQKENIIDDYLAKPYWVVDILPKQVPQDSRGQYFTIEQYYLNPEQSERRCRQFSDLLIKLNCYEDMDVFHSSEQWVHNPHPQTLSDWVLEQKPLFIVMKAADTMIAINGDDTYMTLYNPSEELLPVISALATAEGLFLWKP